MKDQAKKYDAGDVVDVVSIYQSKIELMHYMLEKMRSELNTLKTGYNVHEAVLDSSFKCLEVLEQLSYDNLSYVHEEMVKYKTEWDNEE